MTIRRMTVTESKTVVESLLEHSFSTNHVVIIDGKCVTLTFELQQSDNDAVIPLIAGA